MGKFLSIRNCDVADFAGVTEFSNNLVRFGTGIRNSSNSLARMGETGGIRRLERVRAGMGAMFTPIVSTKWRLGAMKERRMILPSRIWGSSGSEVGAIANLARFENQKRAAPLKVGLYPNARCLCAFACESFHGSPRPCAWATRQRGRNRHRNP